MSHRSDRVLGIARTETIIKLSREYVTDAAVDIVLAGGVPLMETEK